MWHHSLLLMNGFNKTEAAVFSCRLCFLRAFPLISLFTSYILTNFRQYIVIMRVCQMKLYMHVKTYQKNEFVENVWPSNSGLFFLLSLTTIDTFCWLGDSEVTHPPCVQRVWCPALARIFMFGFVCYCCCGFTYLSKTQYLSFCNVNSLVYSTYCHVSNRL